MPDRKVPQRPRHSSVLEQREGGRRGVDRGKTQRREQDTRCVLRQEVGRARRWYRGGRTWACDSLASATTKELLLAAIDTKVTLDIVRSIVSDDFVDHLKEEKRAKVNDCTMYLSTKLISPAEFSRSP